MSLSIEIRKMDRIVILELAGRLSVLESGLKQTAAELIDRGERNFIVTILGWGNCAGSTRLRETVAAT